MERILGSDDLQAAKPSRAAFAPIVQAASKALTVFLDDNIRNVMAARQLGLRAILATASLDWSQLADSCAAE